MSKKSALCLNFEHARSKVFTPVQELSMIHPPAGSHPVFLLLLGFPQCQSLGPSVDTLSGMPDVCSCHSLEIAKFNSSGRIESNNKQGWCISMLSFGSGKRALPFAILTRLSSESSCVCRAFDITTFQAAASFLPARGRNLSAHACHMACSPEQNRYFRKPLLRLAKERTVPHK